MSDPSFDSVIPATASPEVEFISLSHLNPSNRAQPGPLAAAST